MDFAEDELTLSKLMEKNNESDKSKSDKKNEKGDKWEDERRIFETQLNQLQEQLVATMVQKQQLVDENELLKKQKEGDLKKALNEEKNKRKDAEKLANSLLIERKKIMSKIPLEQGYDDLGTEMREELDETDGPKPTSEIASSGRKRKYVKDKMVEYKIILWNFLFDRLSDFQNDDDLPIQEEPDEQLSVKKLKENVSRFSDSIRPIKSFYGSARDLFTWKNKWFTLAVFIIYMYAVYIEMLIPLCLMLMLCQLVLNYLHAKGIASRFTKRKQSSLSKETQKEDSSSSSISEKYTLVLQIATKVQNTFGGFADTLEKMASLFTWQKVESTKLIMDYIFGLFILSCILKTSTFFILVEWFVGIKLFIITPIYDRFPKVQMRYDSLQLMWDGLPTLSERNKHGIESNNGENNLNGGSSEGSGRQSSPTFSMSYSSSRPDQVSSSQDLEANMEAKHFGDRFAIPLTEFPLQTSEWKDGRRCTMMDKDSPLSSMKHGRLYLTRNYLCFERNQLHNKKNVAINLMDILSVKKAKPIPFMPGAGMAIEVAVKGQNKPYLFAAMIGRDEAYDSIMSTGKTLNASWSKK